MPNTNIEELILAIFYTSHLIREHTENREGLNPFSFFQLETLRYVAEKNNPSMKNIADYLCITPPSATSLINRLVKVKQIERTKDKCDRRLVRLVITPKGKKALGSGLKKIVKQMRKVLSCLSKKERVDLIAILQRLSQTYSK